MFVDDAALGELCFQGVVAVAVLCGEDCTVVGEDRSGCAVLAECVTECVGDVSGFRVVEHAGSDDEA